MSNPVREQSEDEGVEEAMQNPNYLKALADHQRRKRWATHSAEEVKQKYANGEIGDDELEDALEVAMSTPDVQEADSIFTTATTEQRAQWWTPRKVYLLLVTICFLLLFVPAVLGVFL